MVYREIPFWQFGLGVAVAAIPLGILEQTNAKWAWAYVLILVLGFAVVGKNAEGLDKASRYFSREMRRT